MRRPSSSFNFPTPQALHSTAQRSPVLRRTLGLDSPSPFLPRKGLHIFVADVVWNPVGVQS